MGSLLSRTVEIEISNKTQNTTLKEPRTFFKCGRCSNRPRPELSPGSSDTCHFSGDPVLWGVWGTTCVSGILVYEAESFSLAIYFSNPVDYNLFPMKMGLELSPGKAHLDDLEATHRRMSKGIYSSSCQDIKFARIVVGRNHETARLSHGPLQVTATMSPEMDSRVKVVLEERRGSGEEAWGENPWDVRGVRFRRSEKETGSRETMQEDSFQDLR